MATQWIQIGLHVTVTLLALFGIGICIEHRLTKIETDVSWLKRKLNTGQCENGGCDDSQAPQNVKE